MADLQKMRTNNNIGVGAFTLKNEDDTNVLLKVFYLEKQL